MHSKTRTILPLLEYAVSEIVQSWPTFDGEELDRTQYVSSSETGKCARQIWYSKNLPPSEGKTFPWGFAQRGHAHEAWIVRQLRALNSEYKWEFIGDDQVSFHHGKQSGTPDGMYTLKGRSHLLELKSIDPRTRVSNLPKPEHIKQVVQNMDLLEVCLDIHMDGALLVYSNASDFSTIYEFYIERDQEPVTKMMMELEDRAEWIMEATKAEDLAPEGMYNGGCKTCAYGSECSAAVMAQKLEKQQHDKLTKSTPKFFG